MRHSRSARDQGLRRVSTITRWIAGVAVALTGLITVWEAQAVHHAGASTPAVVQTPSTSGPSPSSGAGSGSNATVPTSPSGSDGTLQAPDTTPLPTDRQPAATSGGS